MLMLIPTFLASPMLAFTLRAAFGFCFALCKSSLPLTLLACYRYANAIAALHAIGQKNLISFSVGKSSHYFVIGWETHLTQKKCMNV